MPNILNKKNQEKYLEEKEDLIKAKDSNKVIIVFLLLGASLLLSVLVNFLFIYLSLTLATREKIFVMRKGEVEIAQEKDPNFRSEEVIKETVSNFLYLTHEWDSNILNSNNNDFGVKIRQEQDKIFRVPTKSYTASYLLEVGFRKEFLHELSKSVPSSFYTGRVSSVLKIYFIGNTERIDDNLYRVKVIMTRTEIVDGIEQNETQINQNIYLQATRPYQLILGEEEPLAWKKQLNNLLKNGLIIYKISPNVS